MKSPPVHGHEHDGVHVVGVVVVVSFEIFELTSNSLRNMLLTYIYICQAIVVVVIILIVIILVQTFTSSNVNTNIKIFCQGEEM